jgi:hypothetical protein
MKKKTSHINLRLVDKLPVAKIAMMMIWLKFYKITGKDEGYHPSKTKPAPPITHLSNRRILL